MLNCAAFSGRNAVRSGIPARSRPRGHAAVRGFRKVAAVHGCTAAIREAH